MKYTNPKKSTPLKYQGTSKYPLKKYQTSLTDDEYTEEESQDYLGYSERSSISTCVTIPIDTYFKSPSYYRHVVSRIVNTSENDVIEFEIHSGGGQYNGLSALLSALLRTEATSVAYLNGECHSAASMLALSCDSVQVSPFCTMLCHFASFGHAGKGSDVMSAVNHTYNNSVEIFREVYRGFLTEDELDKCIDGKEYWFDAEEIMQRLQAREDMINSVEDESNDGRACTTEELEQYEKEMDEKFKYSEDVPEASPSVKPKRTSKK